MTSSLKMDAPGKTCERHVMLSVDTEADTHEWVQIGPVEADGPIGLSAGQMFAAMRVDPL